MQSIWTRTTLPVHPPLEGRHRCDAVVLGAGMAGILTAWFLRQHGLSVIVLEANRVGSGQTQNTTAKITAQHACATPSSSTASAPRTPSATPVPPARR